MQKPMMMSLMDYFVDLPDPRLDRRKLHCLTDILCIAICAVICGAQHWTQVEQFGVAKESWFRTFLTLENGIPSHNTFADFFAAQVYMRMLNYIFKSLPNTVDQPILR